MPTTLLRRLISLLIRSSGFVEAICRRCTSGKRPQPPAPLQPARGASSPCPRSAELGRHRGQCTRRTPPHQEEEKEEEEEACCYRLPRPVRIVSVATSNPTMPMAAATTAGCRLPHFDDGDDDDEDDGEGEEDEEEEQEEEDEYDKRKN